MGLSLALANPPLIITSGDGRITDLTAASSRSVTFKRNNSHELSFTLPGRHWQAALVEPFVTDVLVYLDHYEPLTDGSVPRDDDNSACIGRFRVIGCDVTGNGGDVSMTFNAVSYRALIERWYFDEGDQLSPGEGPAHAIAAFILTEGQDKASASLGISPNTITVDTLDNTNVVVPIVTRSDTVEEDGTTTPYFEVDSSRADAISGIMDEIGWEWDVRPPADGDIKRQEFVVWQHRGRVFNVDNSAIGLVAGTTVGQWRYGLSVTDYATASVTRGRDWKTHPDLVYRKEATGTIESPSRSGRWEKIFSSEGNTAAQVVADADRLFDNASHPRAGYTLTLLPDKWDGPEDLWLGDETSLVIQVAIDDEASVAERYSVDIAEVVRVESMTIDTDDNGLTTVQVGVGNIALLDPDDIRTIEHRLDRIERR